MDWQDRSPEPDGSDAGMRSRESRTPEGLHGLRVRYARELLEKLAASLREAADIFNQTARAPLLVAGPRRENGSELVELSIEQSGFRFEDAGSGFISVYEVDCDLCEPCAQVQPLLTSAGNLAGWKEQRESHGGGTCAHTLDSLAEAYLIAAVRRKLLEPISK